MSVEDNHSNWPIFGAAAILVATLLGLFPLFFCSQPGKESTLDLRDQPEQEAAPGGTQTVHPRAGTLKVGVPSGALGAEYWVYVDEQIIGSGAGTNALSVVGSSSASATEYYDASGLVAKASPTSFTYVRPNARERLFGVVEELQVADGSYAAQLVVASSDAPNCFPFRMTPRIDFKIDAGRTTALELAVPPNLYAAVAAIGRPVYWTYQSQPNEWLKYFQSHISTAIRNYETSAVVRALNETHGSLSFAPPATGRTLIGLPNELGGRRQVDARQVALMIDSVKKCFSIVPEKSDLDFGQTLSGPLGILFGQLEQQLEAHNRRIADLEDIVRKLNAASK